MEDTRKVVKSVVTQVTSLSATPAIAPRIVSEPQPVASCLDTLGRIVENLGLDTEESVPHLAEWPTAVPAHLVTPVKNNLLMGYTLAKPEHGIDPSVQHSSSPACKRATQDE